MPKHTAQIKKPAVSAREIERKFLVAKPPAALVSYPSAAIVQGYLCYEAGRSQVRVRRVHDERYAHDEYYLTVKGRRGMVRDEINVPLSRANFEALWPLTAGHRLGKRRYYIPYKRLTIELDIFEGARAGLTLVEVEFPDEARALRFVPPAWFGKEVTQNTAYSNRALATE